MEKINGQQKRKREKIDFYVLPRKTHDHTLFCTQMPEYRQGYFFLKSNIVNFGFTKLLLFLK